MASARASLSSETDVTGGIVVKNDGVSLTIKEKGTDVLRCLFFIPEPFYVSGVDGGFGRTLVVVNDQEVSNLDRAKEVKAVKVDMRAEIVYKMRTGRE
jgi:hypothetical protein